MVDLLTGENLSLTETIRKGDKVKFVGNAATNPFPKLQGMCTSAKTSLTKTLTALGKASSGFENLTTEDGLLTTQRFARTYMETLEKVDNNFICKPWCLDPPRWLDPVGPHHLSQSSEHNLTSSPEPSRKLLLFARLFTLWRYFLIISQPDMGG